MLVHSPLMLDCLLMSSRFAAEHNADCDPISWRRRTGNLEQDSRRLGKRTLRRPHRRECGRIAGDASRYAPRRQLSASVECLASGSLTVSSGSIVPVRHPVKLTLEPSSAVVGAAVCRMPPLEIPLPPERRQTMSVPHRLRS
jgi:hypothetical protein